MKVNAISVQNFRGILTNSELVDYNSSTDYDGWNDKFVSSRTETRKREYYPFINETKAEIARAIKPYTLTNYCGNDTTYNEVDVKPALPVTKAKFMQYLNNELLSSESLRIRDLFVKNRLQSFIKENFVSRAGEFHII